MAKCDRRFKPDFVEWMSTRRLWPDAKRFEGWMRDHRDGIKNGVYSKMSRGLPVRPHYIVEFLRFLVTRSPADLDWETASVVARHLELPCWDQEPVESIAQRLMADDNEDYFQRGVDGLIDAIKLTRVIDRMVSVCSNRAEVEDSVRWLYVWVGREMAPEIARGTVSEAIQVAEKHMKLPMEEYARRAVAWHTAEPWAVVKAPGNRTVTAMSVALPLTDLAYESLRRGERRSYEIDPSEIVRPSRNILIEACAERPIELGGNEGNATRHTLIALFAQQAVLAYSEAVPKNEPLRVLSFAGTPRNCQRLKRFGYKRVGTKMPGLPVEWYEKVYARRFSNADFLFLGLFWMAGFFAQRASMHR